MTQPPTPQPLPLARILSEVARLHWHHVLAFAAAALLFSTPLIVMLTPLAAELTRSTGEMTPESMEAVAPRMVAIVLAAIAMGAVLFAYWTRLTLIGSRAALSDDAGGWPLRGLRVAGLFLLTWLAASITLLPVSVLLGLLGTSMLSQSLVALLMLFAMSFYFALFSRRLVEASLDIPRKADAPRPRFRLDGYLRLAGLFSTVLVGLIIAQVLIQTVLLAAGAALTAQVATGIFMTSVVTVFASVHAILYRLQTVPPAA
jgi:hypothetical protein